MEEFRKIFAFMRRDLLTMWTYRLGFFSDWANMVIQIFIFSLIGRMVDPAVLPSYGGRQVGYVEFVAIGIAMMAFMQVALTRMVTAIRGEQLIGTLEVVLATPTSPATFQLGSVAYDLVYVPVRTVIFLMVVAATLDVSLAFDRLPAAIVVMVVFIPFVWGLGEISAAVTLTFRQGAGIVGLFITGMTVFSEGYFPVDVFPTWVRPIAELNPLSVAMNAVRSALLGNAAAAELRAAILYLIPFSVVSLMAGSVAFWLALRRERRNGTLGLY
ncbi:MAG TPA: ABC transporter permease [Acidimicrobiia bacterium]|nr:ABC transporter permease [Acidimicrobiia bacterium]